MMIFGTIVATLSSCGIVAYAGVRHYWSRVQEPGRHRPVA